MYELAPHEVKSYKSFDTAISDLAKAERVDYLATNFKISDEGVLKFEPTQGAAKQIKLTEGGMRRLLHGLKIPASFAFKIIDNSLLSKNINDLINLTGSHAQVITEKIRGEELITGFRTSYVEPLRDFEVLKRASEELSSKGINIRQLVRSTDYLRLHYFDTGKAIDYLYNNEAINVGGDLIYSEYGGKQLEAKSALFLQWCTNGAVLTEEMFKMAYNHTGDRYKAQSAIEAAMLGLLSANGEHLPEMFDQMKNRRPTEKYFRSVRSRCVRNIHPDKLDARINGEQNFFDLFQAITKMAHEDTVLIDERRKMEIVGGNLFSEVKHQDNYVVIGAKPISNN